MSWLTIVENTNNSNWPTIKDGQARVTTPTMIVKVAFQKFEGFLAKNKKSAWLMSILRVSHNSDYLIKSAERLRAYKVCASVSDRKVRKRLLDL